MKETLKLLLVTVLLSSCGWHFISDRSCRNAVERDFDSRTSAPLATVRTAYGRCGEESAFLVAALPHADDNHAWVEDWGRPLLLIFASEDDYSRFNRPWGADDCHCRQTTNQIILWMTRNAPSGRSSRMLSAMPLLGA